MSSSAAFKCLLALLLPFTVAWKLTSKPNDPTAHRENVARFLSNHDFNVVIEDETTSALPMVRAVSGPCTLRVAETSAYGWDRDLVRDIAATDRLLVVFGGKLYEQQPLALTIAYRLWSKLLHTLGAARQVTPVFTLVASPKCDVESLPWREIGRN